MSSQDLFKKVVSHAKEYGYIFQSSEIYDGLSAVYDYGQNGVLLKKNLKEYWWKSMVQLNDNIVGLDSAILMHPKVWEASGHVEAFNDPLIDNKDSKKRYRADILIENYLDKLNSKIQKEIDKAKNKFGEDFEEEKFLLTNKKILGYKEKVNITQSTFSKALKEDNLNLLKKIIEDSNIVCPISGTKNWTDVKQFNLMFETKLGASTDDAKNLFLRPETAQGIFVNFLNVQKTSRLKIPFGIAQIGKAFRNEIVARQFIFRMREFEQMEMQFFIKPGTQKEWYEKWKLDRMSWHLSLGLGKENYKFHDHEKLAHYADAACDIDFKFPFGFKELEGIHSRTDFDLKNHEKMSGKKIKYYDTITQESYTPFVIETSIGLDRMFLAVLASSYCEEKLDDDKIRTVLKIPKIISPIKVAVLPLLKKDRLPELAHEIYNKIKKEYVTIYDEKDAVGRRYRRQDALGTPYCITVDHQSLDDDTFTIRDRDSMEQKRLSFEEIIRILKNETSLNKFLSSK